MLALIWLVAPVRRLRVQVACVRRFLPAIARHLTTQAASGSSAPDLMIPWR